MLGVNTDEQAVEQLLASKRWNVDEREARRLLQLYPNDPALGQPYGWGGRVWPENGRQWKRYQSIATDLTMFAPRRLLAEKMSEHVEDVYSYRWDAPKWNDTSGIIGVNHFSEVSPMQIERTEAYKEQIPFVFGNKQQNMTPLGNDPANIALSRTVMRMWTSFAYDLNPNGHGGKLRQAILVILY